MSIICSAHIWFLHREQGALLLGAVEESWNKGCVLQKLITFLISIFLLLTFFLTGEGGPPDTTFIEDAVLELLKTRRILKCSYPYGFFLEPKSTKKEIYELMQVLVLLSEE